jgi:hypothetical protein
MEYPERWKDYIRKWVRDHEIAGKLTILTEGLPQSIRKRTIEWRSSKSAVEMAQEHIRINACRLTEER